jgi:hypothetical protein
MSTEVSHLVVVFWVRECRVGPSIFGTVVFRKALITAYGFSRFTDEKEPRGWFIDILTINLVKELHCRVSRSGADPAKEA